MNSAELKEMEELLQDSKNSEASPEASLYHRKSDSKEVNWPNMNFLVAVLLLVCGSVGTFCTDWVGPFKNQHNKKLCRRWSIVVLVCGIVLSALLLLGVYFLGRPEN